MKERIEKIIVGPARAASGLPHPGCSMIEMLTLRAAMISNVIAIVPKRI